MRRLIDSPRGTNSSGSSLVLIVVRKFSFNEESFLVSRVMGISSIAERPKAYRTINTRLMRLMINIERKIFASIWWTLVISLLISK